MADPLSIAAGVVGILNAAAQLSSTLTKFTLSVTGAPVSAREVLREVGDVQTILSQLQGFILGKELSDASRTSMLKVDNVLSILSSCVLTFSELEKLLDDLKARDQDVLDRLKWAKKESTILGHIQKLQSHKASLSLILNILNAESITEANDSVKDLCTLVQDCYQEMSSRLQALERDDPDRFSSRTATIHDSSSILTVTQEASNRQTTVSVTGDPMKFDFNEDLQRSWVYSRNDAFRQSGLSLSLDSNHVTRWSVLSSLSMADISTISVLNLPITVTEVFNPHRSEQTWFNEDKENVKVLPGLTKEYCMNMALMHRSPDLLHNPFHPFQYVGRIHCTTCGASVNPMGPHTIVSIYGFWSHGSGDWQIECYRHPYYKSACRKCHQDLKSDISYKLEHYYWHADCYGCYRCDIALGEGYMGRLHKGRLLCRNCLDKCVACGAFYERHSSTKKSLRTCGACRRCYSCYEPILHPPYTSDQYGLLCVQCHKFLTQQRRKSTKLLAEYEHSPISEEWGEFEKPLSRFPVRPFPLTSPPVPSEEDPGRPERPESPMSLEGLVDHQQGRRMPYRFQRRLHEAERHAGSSVRGLTAVREGRSGSMSVEASESDPDVQTIEDLCRDESSESIFSAYRAAAEPERQGPRGSRIADVDEELQS